MNRKERPSIRHPLWGGYSFSAALALCASCGAAASSASSARTVPAVTVVSERGAPLNMKTVAQSARLTVLVFFSAHCECLDVHEARLLALYDAYRTNAVQFLMVDSEVGGSPERDAIEARARRYPFPMVLDPGGKLAGALGAQYATYSVVLDNEGRVRYAGNIDSDKIHLHEDATLYLRNAIDDLLAGRAPRAASGEGLGCALQTW